MDRARMQRLAWRTWMIGVLVGVVKVLAGREGGPDVVQGLAASPLPVRVRKLIVVELDAASRDR